MLFVNFAIGFTSGFIGFFSGYAMWLLVEKRHDR